MDKPFLGYLQSKNSYPFLEKHTQFTEIIDDSKYGCGDGIIFSQVLPFLHIQKLTVTQFINWDKTVEKPLNFSNTEMEIFKTKYSDIISQGFKFGTRILLFYANLRELTLNLKLDMVHYFNLSHLNLLQEFKIFIDSSGQEDKNHIFQKTMTSLMLSPNGLKKLCVDFSIEPLKMDMSELIL